jgi:hypothetical protein
MQRTRCLLLIALLFAVSVLPANVIRKAGAEGQVVLNPTDDTYIDTGNINSNYGSDQILRMSDYENLTVVPIVINRTDIWLKFDLSSVPAGAAVDSATIQLYAVDITEPYNHIIACSCTNNSWSENTLTFSNFPLNDMNWTPSDVSFPHVAITGQWYNWSATSTVNEAIKSGRTAATVVLKDAESLPFTHNATSHVDFASKESALGLSYAPKLNVHWSTNPSGKHQLTLLSVGSSKHLVMTGKPLLVSVLVQNTGDYPESFKVTAYATSTGSQNSQSKTQPSALSPAPLAQKLVIGTQTVMNLESQGTKTVIFLWQTQGCTTANYVISSTITPLAEQAQVINNGQTSEGTIQIQGPGCCIVVAGDIGSDDLISEINEGSNLVYRTLRSVGYSSDDIYLMHQPRYNPQDVDGDGENDVDNNSTAANLKWAIETWASYKVSPTNPLFIILHDHGDYRSFCIARDELGYTKYVPDFSLASWIANLESATGAQVHVFYSACHSGSFIPALSKIGSVIVTSCTAFESSWLGPNGIEYFLWYFWNRVKSGHSIMDTFNDARAQMPLYIETNEGWCPQNPLLDDNGDGTGHMARLPNNGDGFLAAITFIGHCEWPYPWISYVAPTQSLTWPPSSNITLWAEVENRTNLACVRACMLPPDWTPPASNDTLISPNYECFDMTDANHDGNWTVNIPAVNFTSHASGLSNFTFFITAVQNNNDTAVSSPVSIEFTQTGLLPNDIISPSAIIERPLEESVVHGNIEINGTAIDDVCLKKAELYLDGSLIDTVDVKPTTTSYFEFNLDTTTLANGAKYITVKAYDTSGNVGNQTITFYVNNFVHDVAITALTSSDITVQEGNVVNFNATVANEGSYSETFDLTLYANETQIATQPVTLQSGGFTTVSFTWNTTGFTSGNYTLSAQASYVPDENDTTNNNLTLTEQITIPVIVPEFPSMLILPTFMLATLILIVVLRRKRPKSLKT